MGYIGEDCRASRLKLYQVCLHFYGYNGLFQDLLRVLCIQFRVPSLAYVRMAQNAIPQIRLAKLIS